MHYHCEIYLTSKEDVTEQVETVLEPYGEASDTIQETWWDWWQIGGRWTGIHVPDYKPETDPRNHERCTICHGTGFRHDALAEKAREGDPSYTCNACGTFNTETRKWEHSIPDKVGWRVKWPTNWAPFDDDVIEVEKMPVGLTCHTLIVFGVVYQQERWDGEKLIKEWDGNVAAQLVKLGIKTGYLVTVDYHD